MSLSLSRRKVMVSWRRSGIRIHVCRTRGAIIHHLAPLFGASQITMTKSAERFRTAGGGGGQRTQFITFFNLQSILYIYCAIYVDSSTTCTPAVYDFYRCYLYSEKAEALTRQGITHTTWTAAVSNLEGGQ